MTTPIRSLGCLAFSLVLSACSQNVEKAPATTKQALGEIPNMGSVPIPITVKAKTALEATIAPVPIAPAQSAWDGSLVDLMAADALGQCTSGARLGITAIDYGAQPDAYLGKLWGLMDKAACRHVGDNPIVYDTNAAWRASRATPECNLDTRTGRPAVSGTAKGRPSVPALASVQFKLTNGNWYWANNSVAYPELNLCMAARLREKLSSAEMLFASEDQQAEMLGVIRERAQLAAIGYSIVGRAFAMNLSLPTGASSPDLDALASWAQDPLRAQDGHLGTLGDDFATATRILMDVTYEYARFLQRRAAAGWSSENSSNAATKRWGEGSARTRLMNLLYGGGDPLGPVNGPAPAGRAIGGRATVRGAPPAFAGNAIRDPQIQTLLQLARSADALYLRPSSDLSGLDIDPTAERLYRAVEQGLRKKACESNSAATDCSDGTMWQQVPRYPDQFADYLLWKQQRIKPEHATALITSFAGAIGELVGVKTDPIQAGQWANLYPALFEGQFHLLGKHGKATVNPHLTSSAATTEEWLHMDPQFAVSPFRAHELAASYGQAVLPLWDLYQANDPAEVGLFTQQRTAGLERKNWAAQRQAGAVQVLSLVRQSILEGLSSKLAARFFDRARPVLHDIGVAIGNRSATSFPMTYYSPFPAGSPQCTELGLPPTSSCSRAVNNSSASIIKITLPSGDPAPKLAYGEQKRLLQTVAVSPETTTFYGTKGNDLASLFVATPEDKSYGNGAIVFWPAQFTEEGLTTYSFYDFFNQITGGAPGGEALFLVETPPSQPGSPASAPVYTSLFRTGDYGTLHIAMGGVLGTIAEQTMEVSSADWSKPKYDAFGLPNDWVPPADASLVGGAPGEESYRYYLNAAKQSAGQATEAVKTAIDSLTRQAVDQASLDAAEQKAKGNADLQKQSLCGASKNCDLGKPVFWRTADMTGYADPTAFKGSGQDTNCTDANVTVSGAPLGNTIYILNTLYVNGLPNRPTNDLTQIAKDICITQSQTIAGALPFKLQLAKPVYEARDRSIESFSQYAGSELQAVLIRQWNALKGLKLAASSSIKLAISESTKVAGVYKDVDLAAKAFYDTVDEINTDLGCTKDDAGELNCPCGDWQGMPANLSDIEYKCGLRTNTPNGQTLIPEAKAFLERAQADQPLWDNYRAAKAHAESVCKPAPGGPQPWYDADKGTFVNWYGPNSSGTTEFDPSKIARVQAANSACGSGPCLAATTAANDCSDALAAWKAANETVEAAAVAANKLQIAYLKVVGAAAEKLVHQKDRAKEEMLDRLLDRLEAVRDANSRVASSLTDLSHYLSELNESNAALERLKAQATEADSRAGLETLIEAAGVKTRFGLSRAFGSYDMWRARALLQSGRVMALAARRAIEARFVVNLSELTQDQPFVKAPSTWADEVYQSDLDAPAAVGLTPEGGQSDGIYPNKLLDYVGNLERFVQGYATAFPTSVASPDSEVLALPGPDSYQDGAVLSDPAGNATVRRLSAGSKAWSFYCPGSSSWIPHPLANASIVNAQGSTLATACNGSAPSQARYRFLLNPWGQLATSQFNQPFANRYNVRWRRLAVNLVGTGIRDCNSAPSPQDCVANAFVPFSMQHLGPSWVASQTQEWRTFAIPAGVIEGGKALAAEEWLNPVTQSWNLPSITNIGRGEFFGRPIDGVYDFVLNLGTDVHPERIEQVQLLLEQDYWVANDRPLTPGSAAP
ncbi:MAG: hypothetical protein SFV15_17540 [Polyangiaceae bacterium]|nr:hypothetical protein [Polyangiaceae bacterium]